MLKLNNEANNGFVSRAKKQAKNAFKLSKTKNGNVSISNLSQAQEFIANINGFPDWYALQENTTDDCAINLSDYKFTLNDNNQEDFNLPLFDEDRGKTFFVNTYPGGHTSYFYNTFLLESFLEKKPREMVKTVLLNAGNLYSVNYLKGQLEESGVMLSCSSESFYCNFMAFPFGESKYTFTHRELLLKMFQVFFQTIKEIDFIVNKSTFDLYIQDFLDFIESNKFKRKYVAGTNYKLDLFVEKYQLKEKSWKEISEFALRKNEDLLAREAHCQSCACFRDLIQFNSQIDLGKYVFDTKDVFDLINKKVRNWSLIYPNLTLRKQTDLRDVKLLAIDCENDIFLRNEKPGCPEVGFFMAALSLAIDLHFFENDKLTGVQGNKPGVFFNQILSFNEHKNLVVDLLNLNERVSKFHFLQNAHEQYNRICSSSMIFNCSDRLSALNLEEDITRNIEKGNWLFLSPESVSIFNLLITKKYSRVIQAEKERFIF